MKEKSVRRILSFVIALTMTFSQGITSFAADDSVPEIVSEGESSQMVSETDDTADVTDEQLSDVIDEEQVEEKAESQIEEEVKDQVEEQDFEESLPEDSNDDEVIVDEEKKEELVTQDAVFTLDGNGGIFWHDSDQTVVTLPSTTQYLESYTPYREGYTFIGWFEDKEQTTCLSYSESLGKLKTMPTLGTTIYAGWAKDDDSWKITYIFGGEEDENKSKPYDTGYYYYGNGGNTSDMHRVYKLEVVIPKGKKIGDKYQPDVRYIRNTDYHYVFHSWYTNKERTLGPTNSLTDVIPDGDTTFYAQYSNNSGNAKNVVITFDGNDGENAFFPRENYDYSEQGDHFSKMYKMVSPGSSFSNMPEPDYYVQNSDVKKRFTGWYTDAGCKEGTLVEPDDKGYYSFSQDITLYAGWTSDNAVISFDPNGGFFYDHTNKTKNENPVKLGSDGSQKYFTPGNIYNDDLHLQFQGWAHDQSATEAEYPVTSKDNTGYVSSTGVSLSGITKDTTLYAVWKSVYPVATLDLGEGSFTYYNLLGEAVTQERGSIILCASNDGKIPEKYLYEIPEASEEKIFANWTKTGSTTSIQHSQLKNQTLSADTTFTAKYANAVNITYNGNGGYLGKSYYTDKDPEYTYETSEKVRANFIISISRVATKKDGSRSTCWCLDSACKKLASYNGSLTQYETPASGNITLYACWGEPPQEDETTPDTSSITLDKEKMTLTSREGVSGTLTATLKGDIKDKGVTWTSSDSEVLTVKGSDDTKTATLVPKSGLTETKTVTVTATADGTSYKAECLVVINPAAKVSAPTASLEQEAVKAGSKLELKSDTFQASIYYTTDGSEPKPEEYLSGTDNNGSTKLYDNVISITKDTTIKAVAVKNGLNNSEVKTFKYTIIRDQWGDIAEDIKALFENDSSKIPDGIWYLLGDKEKIYTQGGVINHSEVYTGNNITFAEGVSVYYNTEKLQENRDYTVKYANNKLASEASAKKAPSVTVTGKGSFNKKAVFTFAINKADLKENENVTVETDVDVTEGTKLSNVKPSVTYMGKKLTFGKDYSAEYYKDAEFSYKIADPAKETVKAETKYYIKLTAKENTNYKNDEAFATVTAKGYDSKTTVVASRLKMVDRKGKALKLDYGLGPFDTGKLFVSQGDGTPVAYIKDGKTVLTKDVDYTVKNIVEDDYKSVGIHKLLIECNGTTINGKTYTGSHVFEFEITGKSFSKNVKVAGLASSVEYTGKPVALDELFTKDKLCEAFGWTKVTLYTIQKNGRLTVYQPLPNEAYSLSMDNNGTPGKIKVTFTGKDGWTGSIIKTVTVKPYNMQKNRAGKLNVSVADGVVYSKAGAMPAVEVKFGDTILKEGIDYTLSYKNNKKVVADSTALNILKASARPTVIVKGKGNFTGTNATEYFCISKASAAGISVTAGDVTYNKKGKNGYFMVVPKLLDDGKAIAAGKNKDVEAIAKSDKPSSFFRSIYIQRTANLLRIVSNDTDHASIQPCESHNQIGRIGFLHLKN